MYLNLIKLRVLYIRHIWLYDRGDYQSLSYELSETDWDSLKNRDINIYAANFTEQLTKLASRHIPNKTINVRKSDPVWLNNYIKRLMRKRKRYMINIEKQIKLPFSNIINMLETRSQAKFVSLKKQKLINSQEN